MSLVSHWRAPALCYYYYYYYIASQACMGGEDRLTITSMWSQSAPILRILLHSSPRVAKSAERTDGQMVVAGRSRPSVSVGYCLSSRPGMVQICIGVLQDANAWVTQKNPQAETRAAPYQREDSIIGAYVPRLLSAAVNSNHTPDDSVGR